MLVIVDYGVGNLASISNMLKKIGVNSLVTSNAQDVRNAEKIILPGVGSFDTCASKLQQSELIPVLTKRVQEDKTPVLGICVGMQLLLEGSEEGKLPGLGWIKGSNIKFRQEKLPAGYKVPHMGWSDVNVTRSTKIFENMNEPRFYFVHSYHAQPANIADVNLMANYGYDFAAGVEQENILGIQFHPEKSHHFGMELFRNFIRNY